MFLSSQMMACPPQSSIFPFASPPAMNQMAPLVQAPTTVVHENEPSELVESRFNSPNLDSRLALPHTQPHPQNIRLPLKISHALGPPKILRKNFKMHTFWRPKQVVSHCIRNNSLFYLARGILPSKSLVYLLTLRSG